MRHSLEVDGVMLAYGDKWVLRDVYLKSETGKITGVLGRNGTGKSSLFKIMFGEVVTDSQSVRMNGVAYLSTHRSPEDLRYLPQQNFVPRQLTIGRVFADFGVDFQDLLNFFPDFEGYRKARMAALSSGQRRIIEIFLVLTSRTKFCILDEPFSQVMPVFVDILKKIILREKANKGIILSDHLYQEIVEVADELYVISEGKIHLVNGMGDLERLGYIKSRN
jgi:ABC-type multidrug transport system ATPase subunit